MVTYKNITVKKRGGGTRLQRVKVLASGKYKFVKNLASKVRVTRRKTTKKNKHQKRRKSNLARRRKKNRRNGGNFQQKAFKLVRIGALIAPAAAVALSGGTARQKIIEATKYYTGFNMDMKKFIWGDLAVGYTPFLASVLATYGIPKISGVIRRL